MRYDIGCRGLGRNAHQNVVIFLLFKRWFFLLMSFFFLFENETWLAEFNFLLELFLLEYSLCSLLGGLL